MRQAFPGLNGVSARNLEYMRRFAELWPAAEFVQQPAAQLPWFHICTIMDKLHTEPERQWYMHKAIEHRRSRVHWSTKSKAACWNGKAKPQRILPNPCQP